MGKEQEYCDSKGKLLVIEEEESFDPENELPIPEEQGCCPIVEPWIGPEMGPVPEELECGPMEEQWIAIEMGCISQERGAWKVLEQSCIEEVVVEPQEEKFKYEIFRCDAMVHPNICVSKWLFPKDLFGCIEYSSYIHFCIHLYYKLFHKFQKLLTSNAMLILYSI